MGLIQERSSTPFGLGTSSFLFGLIGSGILVYVVYVSVVRPIYNVFFHPLSKYPGPKLWAAYRIPYVLTSTGGQIQYKLLELHCRYGDVVRVAPNELSYVRPDAWKQIMGHRKHGEAENAKEPLNYMNFADSIIGAGRQDHAHGRRVLSHGFSAKRMLEQEPLIRKYIDLLFERLPMVSDGGSKPVDIVRWYNYTTFDIIGDLTFGDSFHCLDSQTMHPWVQLIFASVKDGNLITNLRQYYAHIDRILYRFFPSAVKSKMTHEAMLREKLKQRQAMGMERPDFYDSMTRRDKGGPGFSPRQIEKNSDLLIGAGSETTATVLSFSTYLLCKNPEVQAKAAKEVREMFNSEDEIDMTRVQQLHYLLAVLNESMRIWPAAPAEFPRQTPPEGSTVCGEFIPGNTILLVAQYPCNHYPGNWVKPEEFIPERWLKDADPIYEADKKDAFNPFNHGGRDCIGKNLAYSEMRMILARMLFNYDMELDEQSKNWADGMPAYILWDKPEMFVHLKPRKVET
ncbi:hypothetical protein PspLS_01571 [Pyricularia sp. CBS 133598]|nr:hypothetical protein PspLS_01571 [Pyricularia sp. CBS 133598]